MRYKSNPKHHPASPGRRGTRCPQDIDAQRAHQLLQGSVQDGQKRYATDGELAYCAYCDDPEQDVWHGFPVQWDEVPEKIRRSWITQDAVKRSTINRANRGTRRNQR